MSYVLCVIGVGVKWRPVCVQAYIAHTLYVHHMLYIHILCYMFIDVFGSEVIREFMFIFKYMYHALYLVVCVLI